MLTVYYRECDGKGTKVYLRELNKAAALFAKNHYFNTRPQVTMCWVLDENGNMVGDPLDRDPPLPN